MTIRILLLSAFFVSAAHAFEGWKGFSSPAIMASGFTHTMKELPLAGDITDGNRAWSGHYWPTQEGGINVRWNHPQRMGFKYDSPTKADVLKMSLEDLAKLAPTEKYDLLTGNYDYPLKNRVAKNVKPTAPDWSGICHGWSPATLHHNEPTPKVLTNPDGIKIPFASSDIKALLSYYYAKDHKVETSHQVGRRCFYGSWLGGSKTCNEDLNAGAFHIILTNMLGLRKEGFVADIDRYKEVWNQPIVGYKSKIVEDNIPVYSTAATTAVKVVKMTTEFFYVDEVDRVTWDVVIGTKDQLIAKKDYSYYLEIDAAGKIVGGAWISDTRPDFLWDKEKATEFKGMLSRLPELLND